MEGNFLVTLVVIKVGSLINLFILARSKDGEGLSRVKIRVFSN